MDTIARGRVIRVRTRDDTRVKRYNVGDYPADVISDGTSIWVSNLNSGTVSKISPSR